MTSLTDFLLARIAEDAALGGVWSEMAVAGEDRCVGQAEHDDVQRCWDDFERRIKADADAKRWLVGVFRPINYTDYNDPEILRRIALPYADHPDYREEWRP